MKLPVYLRCGVYYLHTRLNGRQIKVSLRTRDKDTAMLRALALYPNLMMNRKAPPSMTCWLASSPAPSTNLKSNGLRSPPVLNCRASRSIEQSHDVQSLLNLVNSLSLPVNAPTSDFTPHDVPNPHQADKTALQALNCLNCSTNTNYSTKPVRQPR